MLRDSSKMKLHYTLYLVKFLLVNVYPAATQTLRHASFSVIPNSIYIPQFSSNFIINFTSNTISNTSKCAEKCLSYTLCQTATYYAQQQTCSLYNEKSNAGQIATAVNQSSTVVAMISREPKSCVVSSQSSWLPNATTVAGSSSGTAGSSLSLLNTPIPMFYDQSYKQIFVGDHGNQRVLRFSLGNSSANGTVVAGGNGGGCALNQFWSVTGLAMDSFRQLFLSDSGCSRILRFPPNSNSTSFATQLISISLPQGMSINPWTDELYVAVYGTSSIIKFGRNNSTSVVVAGGNGVGSGLNQVNAPNSVYFDYLYTNSLYVVDSGNNRILRFPANSTSATYGTIVAGIGSSGNGANQFNNPRAVVIDKNGILYVSDKDNWRIQRWLPNATSGVTIVGGTQGTAANQFGSTESFFFDENNKLYVVDRDSNRIQMFTMATC